MYAVENPRSSARLAVSRRSRPDAASRIITPNRNFRAVTAGTLAAVGLGTSGTEAAGRPEAVRVAGRRAEVGDLAPGRVRDRLDHELRDAIAAAHGVRLPGVRVHQEHLELAAVERVDEARRVEAGDAVLERETRAWEHEAGVPGRDG